MERRFTITTNFEQWKENLTAKDFLFAYTGCCRGCPLSGACKLRPSQRPDDIRQCSERLSAWANASAEAENKCKTCRWYSTDSYKYYGYPCSECKFRSEDSYEQIGEGVNQDAAD